MPTFRCSHQFSWPRRWRDGNYYQVCVRCGAEYLYDWDSMQRAGRFERELDSPEPDTSKKAASWRPRARRISVEVQIQFREPGSEEWHPGVIRNVSETGVLIFAEGLLPAGAEVELKFVMPKGNLRTGRRPGDHLGHSVPSDAGTHNRRRPHGRDHPGL